MKLTNRATFLEETESRVALAAIVDDGEREAVLKAKLAKLPPDGSVRRFHVDELDLKALLEHLETSSLFGGAPIAILDRVEKLTKKTVEALCEWGKRFAGEAYFLMGAAGKTPLVDESWLLCLDALAEKPWDREKRLKERLLELVRKSGKDIAPRALDLLLERNEMEGALLEQEIEKLICWTGERRSIGIEDVEAISSSNRLQTLWQEAEQIVWEGMIGGSDPYALFPLIRSQLEMGLKIATLIEEARPKEEWSRHLPKVYPRLLEKRTPQAARLGRSYFIEGLKTLFDLELLSRSGSESPHSLLTLLQAKLGRR